MSENIAGMTADEVLMQINDLGVHMRVMEWAKTYDPMFAAITKATRSWPDQAAQEALIVGMLCAKVRSEENLLTVYRNLKSADIIVQGNQFGVQR